MPDLESRLRRELAARVARPAPPRLPLRIREATTRRPATRGRERWIIGFAAAVAAAVVLCSLTSFLLRSGWGPSFGPAAQPAGPSPRDDPALAYDADHGVVLLFGGRAPSKDYPEDTLVWDGRGWHRLSPAHHPTGRSYALTAFDVAHHVVVLFGGEDDDGYTRLQDTWTWDGQDWTRVAADGPTFAPLRSAMAYDPAYGQVLLVTPGAGVDAKTETWAWDGHAWRQIPVAGPDIQQFAAMGLDRASNRDVLITTPEYADSGAPGSPTTWTWGRGGWSRVDSAVTPPALGAGLATDPVSGHLLVFNGGRLYWSWTGAGWRKSKVAGSDLVIGGCACAAGDARAGVVLHFGGHYFPALPQSPGLYATWTWTAAGGWRQVG